MAIDPEFWRMIINLDDGHALSGPDGCPDDTEINDIMASDLETALSDYCVDGGITDLDQFLIDTLVDLYPLRDDGDIRIVPAVGRDGTDHGVIALTVEYRIAGIFAGSTLCVDPVMAGRGIGRRLVIERMLRDGGLPTWDHDTPGYSRAGAATVLSAVAELQIMAGAALAAADTPHP